MPELVFTAGGEADSPGADLAAALAERVAAQDAVATLTEGNPPPPRADRIHVLVEGAGAGLEPPLVDPLRAIAVLRSPPGAASFARGIELARRVGAAFHLNSAAVEELKAAGVAARHLQIGDSPLWAEKRVEDELTIVSGTGGYFDWVSALRAIAAGSVVLHERALGIAPLVPGRDLFVAAPAAIETVAAALRAEPERLASARREGREFIEAALPMDLAASALVGVARGLVAQPGPVSTPGQQATMSK